MNKSNNFIALLFMLGVAAEDQSCKGKLCNKEEMHTTLSSLSPHNAEGTSSLADKNEYTATTEENKYDVQSMNTKKWEDGVIASINTVCLISELTLAANELQNDALDMTNVQQRGVLRHSKIKPAVVQLNGETWELFNTASKNMEKVTQLMFQYFHAEKSYAKKIVSGASMKLIAKVLPIIVESMKAPIVKSMKLLDETKRASDNTKILMFVINEALTGQEHKYVKDVLAKMKIEVNKLQELYSSMHVLLQQLLDGLDPDKTAYLGKMEDDAVSKKEQQDNVHRELNKLRTISGSIAFVTMIYTDVLKNHVMNTMNRQLNLAVVAKKDVNEFRDELAETCKKSVDASKSMIEVRKAKLFNN